jgi:RimJ/RimL family protein N-acetyltransferase
MPGPAYRVRTPRLLLRSWNPEDAPLLLRSVTESLEHLLPWLPWAKNEPEPLDEKVTRLRTMRGKFDLGQDFIYAIFDRDDKEVVGGTGLHPRVGPDAFEIGYWIDVNHVGRGYATEAAGALTRVAFEIEGVRRVEIRCDPSNDRSSAVPRKLGYTHDATLRKRSLSTEGEERDLMIWSLLREDYATSPAASAQLEAFDALGRRLI